MAVNVKTIGGVRTGTYRCLLSCVRSPVLGLLITATVVSNVIGQLLYAVTRAFAQGLRRLLTARPVRLAVSVTVIGFTVTTGAAAAPSADTAYRVCERAAAKIRRSVPRAIAHRACTQITIPTTTATPTTTVAFSSARQGPLEQLARLQVAGEVLAGYDRDAWPHWSDVDSDGCNTRKEVLKAQSTTPVQIATASVCTIVSGTWVDPYSGGTYTSPTQIEIDHIVPLANAYRSGGYAWTTPQREAFANDPAELVATSSAANTTKADKRPDQWLPPRPEARCWYVTTWIAIKTRYQLTITTTERDTLASTIHQSC